MELNIGPFIYRVYLWHGLIEHEGQQCIGLCDHDQRCVLISDTVSDEQRMQVLCHEAWHAWRHHFAGQSKTAEGEADLVGLVLVGLIKDLEGKIPAGLSRLNYTSKSPDARDQIAAKSVDEH